MTGADLANHEELRIALVMNGGVSLAVWIGGLTNEINRLVRRDEVYGELLDLLAVRPCVDVISGTSAGGINGALLALAMVRGQSLGMLRDLWVEKAALGELLRDPLEPLPSSLLRGDEYFLRELQQAFAQINASGSFASASEVPIHLTLTATLLKGEPLELADDFGRAISDVRHAVRFRFRRGTDVEGDPFARSDIVERLALAARSTASFPVAFEPSFVPIRSKNEVPGRPDLSAEADFGSSRFVMDGGILDNRPLGPAIEAIAQQRTHGDMRRVLMYVVPDPSESGSDVPDELEKAPSARRTAIASLLEIPRVEPVAAEIRAIRDRNRRVLEGRESRVMLTNALGGDAEQRILQLGKLLFPLYRARRTHPAISYVVSQLADGVAALAAARRKASDDEGEAGQPSMWLERQGYRAWLAEAFRAQPLPWVPQTFPDAPIGAQLPPELRADEWCWGIRCVEHALSTVLDVLRRAQRLAPFQHESRRRGGLPSFWAKAYDVAAHVRRVRRSDGSFWQGKAESLAALLGRMQPANARQTKADAGELGNSPLSPIQEWVASGLAEWCSREHEEASGRKAKLPAVMGAAAHGLAALLHEASDTVRALARQADRTSIERERREAIELLRLIDYLAPPDSKPEDVLLRLVRLDVVQYALGTSTEVPDQYVELIQVSGNTPSPFGARSRASDKLAGVQLGHFAAFYKRSWRANDWMHGRLDGAASLAQVVLGPERLRRLALQRDKGGKSLAAAMADEIQRIAVDGEADPDSKAALRARWDRAVIERELSYLDHPELPAPDSLPLCADAIGRRMQLAILRECLVTVGEAAELDEAESGYWPGAGMRLAHALRQHRLRGSLGAEETLNLFSTHHVGAERIEDQVGADLFSMTVARALAVASSVGYREVRDQGTVRYLFRIVRAVSLAFYLITRNAVHRSRTGIALNSAVIAIGATIVVLALAGVEKMPALSVTLGWVLLGGGLLAAFFRWWEAVLVGLVLAGLVWIFLSRVQEAVPWLAWDRLGPLVAIVAIAGSLIAFGALRRPRWLQERSARRRREKRGADERETRFRTPALRTSAPRAAAAAPPRRSRR